MVLAGNAARSDLFVKASEAILLMSSCSFLFHRLCPPINSRLPRFTLSTCAHGPASQSLQLLSSFFLFVCGCVRSSVRSFLRSPAGLPPERSVLLEDPARDEGGPRQPRRPAHPGGQGEQIVTSLPCHTA